MNKSLDRGLFGVKMRIEEAIKEGRDPETDADLIETNRFDIEWEDNRRKQEDNPEWRINNLEYDLRSNTWICDKVKAKESYAQNLYAAMCNNEFQRNETWPVLADKRWCCSWRYAGGIVADMCETGDYIEWYCSGIRGNMSDEEFGNLTKEQQESYLYAKNYFVGESVVTEEIEADLLKLGWIVIKDSQGDY